MILFSRGDAVEKSPQSPCEQLLSEVERNILALALSQAREKQEELAQNAIQLLAASYTTLTAEARKAGKHKQTCFDLTRRMAEHVRYCSDHCVEWLGTLQLERELRRALGAGYRAYHCVFDDEETEA